MPVQAKTVASTIAISVLTLGLGGCITVPPEEPEAETTPEPSYSTSGTPPTSSASAGDHGERDSSGSGGDSGGGDSGGGDSGGGDSGGGGGDDGGGSWG